jgi:hypothetical protein
MRIAVCCSGAQRFESNAVTLLLRSLPHDAHIDYFCYVHAGELKTDDELKAFLQDKTERRPANIFAKVDNAFAPNLDFPHVSFPETKGENVLRMFFAIRRCGDMKVENERKDGVVYDFVFRVRPETALSTHFDLSFYAAMKDLFVVFPWSGHWRGGLNDQFAFSSSANMDIYASVWDHIVDHCQNNCPFHPETLVKYHLLKMGVLPIIAPIETRLLRY